MKDSVPEKAPLDKIAKKGDERDILTTDHTDKKTSSLYYSNANFVDMSSKESNRVPSSHQPNRHQSPQVSDIFKGILKRYLTDCAHLSDKNRPIESIANLTTQDVMVVYLADRNHSVSTQYHDRNGAAKFDSLPRELSVDCFDR